jgi:hypothetical protein
VSGLHFKITNYPGNRFWCLTNQLQLLVIFQKKLFLALKNYQKNLDILSIFGFLDFYAIKKPDLKISIAGLPESFEILPKRLKLLDFLTSDCLVFEN